MSNNINKEELNDVEQEILQKEWSDTNKITEEKKGKSKNLLKIILGFISIKFVFVFLMICWFFMLIMNFISTLPGTFLPKNSSSTIAFYQADSFFGIPVNYRNDMGTVPEIANPISVEQLNEMENNITTSIQERLDGKFWTGTYIAKFFRSNTYTQDNHTYQNLMNITQQMEDIYTFWVEIKKWENGTPERIYFYSLLKEDLSFWDKVSIKFGSDVARSWFKDPATPNGEWSIFFLKNIKDAPTIGHNFLEFVKLMQSWKGNDWRDKGETKEAFQYLLWQEGEEWNDKIITNIEFYPYFSENFRDWWVDALGTSWCAVKYTVSEKDQLDCSEWVVKIKISDEGWAPYPKEFFRNKSYTIKNVVMVGPEKIRMEMRNYTNVITKYNQIKLHKSYFVDMLNFVGSTPWNSNQKVLSQERINLEYFSKKNLWKTNSTLVLNPSEVNKFTPLEARKILDMPWENDVQDSTFIVKNWEQNNHYEIYKNSGWYSTDAIVSKCSGLPVVYPSVDALIYWFQYNETIWKCVDKSVKPALLKKWEVKYYKRFHFVWDAKDKKTVFTTVVDKVNTLKDKLQWGTTNKNEWKVVTRKRDEYKLNYFYHFSEPSSVWSNVKAGALWEWNYVSDIGLDNKTILWNGIYIKAYSYWLVAKEKDGSFDVLRDSRDGTPLFDNLPIEFEVGLLTSLDDKIFESVNEKGKIALKERKNEIVQSFDNVNKQFAKIQDNIDNHWTLWRLMNVFNSAKYNYLNDKSLVERGQPYNTLFSKFVENNQSALDNINLKSWDDLLLEVAGPTYVRKWNERYLNKYFNDSNKQRNFTELLDTIYYQKTNDKFTFTPKAVLEKYSILFWKLPEDLAESYSVKYNINDKWSSLKSDTLTNFICKDYIQPSAIWEKYNKLREEMKWKDSSEAALTKFIVDNQSTMFNDCFVSYFEQVVMDVSQRKELATLIDKKRKGDVLRELWQDIPDDLKITPEELDKITMIRFLDLDNSNHKIFPKLFLADKDQNDLYFLYDYLRSKWVTTLKTPDGEWKLNTYLDFIYFIMEKDKNYNNDTSFYLSKLQILVNALDGTDASWSKTDLNKPMKEFLSKLDDKQKAFYLYDYRWFQVLTEPFKNEKTVINNLKVDKERTYFVNVDNAFSYTADNYDKDEGLHELHINPNVYLYSYFKWMKRDNPTMTVNVKGEDNLWYHNPANFDKYKFDSAVMFNYADNIDNNILLDPHLKNYAELTRQYYGSNLHDGAYDWIVLDYELMQWFSKNTLNDMVKYGVMERYYRNLPLYRYLWTFNHSPLTDGNALSINLMALREKGYKYDRLPMASAFKYRSFLNALENYLPELDLLLRNNALKTEAEFADWNAMEQAKKYASHSEDYSTYLWSVLTGNDPNMNKTNQSGSPQFKIERITDSMEYAINKMVEWNSIAERNEKIMIYDYLNQRSFGFWFAPEVSGTNGLFWWISGSVWSYFSSDAWQDLVLTNIKPKYSESMLHGLYRTEEAKRELEEYLGANGKYNEWIQQNIGVPYNMNRQYSKTYVVENFVDHAKLKDYFKPIVNFDPANDPYKTVSAGSGPTNDAATDTILNVNSRTSSWSTDNKTTEEYLAVWKNNKTPSTQSGTTNSTNTGSVNTTGSGETNGSWSGETSSGTWASSYTSINSINLGTNTTTWWFKKNVEGMTLKNYKVYTDGNINTIETKKALRTDLNATIDAIAKLEYFPGVGEIEITESLSWLTWRPDGEAPTLNNTGSTTTNSGSTETPQSSSWASLTSNSFIETYKDMDRQLAALERNKQCMVFLEGADKNLYEALYRFEIQNDQGGVFNMFNYGRPKEWLDLVWLSYNDKLSIFTFLVENKEFLNCWGLTKDDYKIYIDYVRTKIQEEVDSYPSYDEEMIKSYKIYNNVSKLQLPSTYTYRDDNGLASRNKASIQSTPAYLIQSAMFLNKGNYEANNRNSYKFVATTKWLWNNVIISDQIEQFDSYMLNIHLNMMINTMLANKSTLYEGLRELSREMYNYSEKRNISKITTFSNIDNLWPFYYIYTNNGYIKPENGINFELVDLSAMNNWVFGGMNGLDPSLMFMDPAMFSAYGEKVWVNAYLDKLSSTYCEQKTWDDRIMCKNYMEYLKWMSMASYKQEMEYLSFMLWAGKLANKYIVVWGIAYDKQPEPNYLSNTVIGSQGAFKNNMQSKYPDFYNKHLALSFETARNGSYVWQCTWFTQLYKDYSSSWHWSKVVANLRWQPWVTIDSFSPSDPDHAFKVMQPWDVISFNGFNGAWWCIYSSVWHVAMVVKTNPAEGTVTLSEGNAKNWFQTNVKEYKLKNMCSWQVAHWVKARYWESSVVFEKWNDIVSSINSNSPSNTWSGSTTNTNNTASWSTNSSTNTWSTN